MTATSVFPSAVSVSAPSGPTLTLNTLTSNDQDFSSPYFSQVGVRVLTNGDVQELSSAGSWVSQNSGVEWIDDGGATSSQYEVMLVKSSGTITLSGPTLSTYHTISTTRQWTYSKTTVGTANFSGTMYIREIADTSNIVSAAVTMFVENGTL